MKQRDQVHAQNHAARETRHSTCPKSRFTSSRNLDYFRLHLGNSLTRETSAVSHVCRSAAIPRRKTVVLIVTVSRRSSRTFQETVLRTFAVILYRKRQCIRLRKKAMLSASHCSAKLPWHSRARCSRSCNMLLLEDFNNKKHLSCTKDMLYRFVH